MQPDGHVRRFPSRLRRFLYRLAGVPRELILSQHYNGLHGLRIIRRETILLRRNRRRFTAVADPAKIVWVRPQCIESKLNYDLDLIFNDIRSGDWDVERRAKLEAVAKHRSIVQRFVQGLEWEDTEIFKRHYARRFSNGEKIRGARNPEDLARKYCREIDALFEDMRKHGFIMTRDGDGHLHSLPHLHIGRNGDLILGNNGNHRVAMAKVLNIEPIPCWVRSRHSLWQEVRENVAKSLSSKEDAPLDPKLRNHPDLADILESHAGRPYRNGRRLGPF